MVLHPLATRVCFQGRALTAAFSAEFSPHPTGHATDGPTRTMWGLFLDSASTLFFGGVRFGSKELLEDNSSSVATSLSSGRIGSLPLFCLIRGAG